MSMTGRMTAAATIAAALIGSLAFFLATMGLGIGLVLANAAVSPQVVWFPLPLLALLVGITAAAEWRFRIGLRTEARLNPQPQARSRASITAMTLGIALVGVAACVLQGALASMTLAAETGPAGTSRLFQFSYAVLLSVTPAVLAEVAFRGLLQSRLEPLWGPWPAILLITAINTAAHRWGPDLAAQWLGYFVALAGLGWLRSVTGSLWPPLLAHTLTNLAIALALWHFGPFAQGGIGDLGRIALVALLGAGFLVARIGMQPKTGSPRSGHSGTS